MSDRITIKDIANELKLHHSTVSRALRNDSRIKEKTRRRVAMYANEQGYQVNMSALHLRGIVKNSIAVIIPNLSHRFFSDIVSSVTNLASRKGYVVSVYQSNESIEQEKAIIKTIIQNNVAGVLASVSMQTTDADHFYELKRYKIPLVFFDRVCGTRLPYVKVDNFTILGQAVDLLVKGGYTRIAHISGPGALNVFRDRQDGYSKAIKTNGLEYSKILEVNKDFSIEDGKEAAKALLESSRPADAIITDSYILALGVISELHKRKLRIPGDVGIICFGENPSLEFVGPGITSIWQHEKEIAGNACQLLFNQMENDKAKANENVLISATIIERGSSKKNVKQK